MSNNAVIFTKNLQLKALKMSFLAKETFYVSFFFLDTSWAHISLIWKKTFKSKVASEMLYKSSQGFILLFFFLRWLLPVLHAIKCWNLDFSQIKGDLKRILDVPVRKGNIRPQKLDKKYKTSEKKSLYVPPKMTLIHNYFKLAWINLDKLDNFTLKQFSVNVSSRNYFMNAPIFTQWFSYIYFSHRLK